MKTIAIFLLLAVGALAASSSTFRGNVNAGANPYEQENLNPIEAIKNVIQEIKNKIKALKDFIASAIGSLFPKIGTQRNGKINNSDLDNAAQILNEKIAEILSVIQAQFCTKQLTQQELTKALVDELTSIYGYVYNLLGLDITEELKQELTELSGSIIGAIYEDLHMIYVQVCSWEPKQNPDPKVTPSIAAAAELSYQRYHRFY